LIISSIAANAQCIISEVERVIVGKPETVTKAVIALLCKGHLLIEDIPGVGKTTLAKSLARSIGGEFRPPTRCFRKSDQAGTRIRRSSD